MKTKLILGIGMILLIALLNSINSFTIIPVYPENNSIITDKQPAFKWIGKPDKIIIDDNDEFISPIMRNVEGNSYKIKDKLNFTTYYWKLVGKKETSVLQFTIDSIVALQLKNQSRQYNISNIGNSNLDVEIQEENGTFWKITGGFALGENETKQFEVKNSTLFTAKEK